MAQDFDSGWLESIKTKRPLTYEYQKLRLLYSLDAFEQNKGEAPWRMKDRKIFCPDWGIVLKQLKDNGLIEIVPSEEIIKLTSTGKEHIGEHRIYNPDGFDPEPSSPKIHVAPTATGSRVVEDEALFPTIARYERKVLGVEMEGSAIGVVAAVENVDYFIMAKSVVDYADAHKNDHFRTYAIETSYRFIVAFLKENLPSSRVATNPLSLQLNYLSTLQSKANLIGEWANLHQQSHAINLNLIILLGLLSADDLESTLNDVQFHWTLECSGQIKYFVHLNFISQSVKQEFMDFRQVNTWLDSLRFAAEHLDKLTQQSVPIEDLSVSTIRNLLLDMLRINGEMLRFLSSRLQKDASGLHRDIEVAVTEAK